MIGGLYGDYFIIAIRAVFLWAISVVFVPYKFAANNCTALPRILPSHLAAEDASVYFERTTLIYIVYIYNIW